MNKQEVTLFGITFDSLTLAEAAQAIGRWAKGKTACRYVVPTNVNGVVLFNERADLRAAYAEASLVLADGYPILWAARLLGKPLPERVAGSDLVPALFSVAKEWGGFRVFLLGAADGVADRAAAHIHESWPEVIVSGTYSPPQGFENDPAECARILQMIANASPDILLIGLGAPKQELWLHQYSAGINARVAICVGATIDFLAGEKKRAPLWMRKRGLEWLYRILSEPRRLTRRYLHDAWIFPQLIFKEWQKGKNR